MATVIEDLSVDDLLEGKFMNVSRKNPRSERHSTAKPSGVRTNGVSAVPLMPEQQELLLLLSVNLLPQPYLRADEVHISITSIHAGAVDSDKSARKLGKDRKSEGASFKASGSN